MADGDNVKPSTLKHSMLLDRNHRKGYSYFFNHQVERCITEQQKILASKLVEKEEEAGITYDKALLDQFGPTAQIDSTFVQLIFGSDAPVNLDGLIDELRTLATSDNNEGATRLLDLLLVTQRKTALVEEQEIREISYDLYDKEFKGKYDSIAAFNNLYSYRRRNSSSMAMVLAMMASGEEEIIKSALISMATDLNRPWDALVLSRFFYGSSNAFTRKIDDEWKSTVMKAPEFRVINMTRSFDAVSLKETARTLLNGMSNKQELTGMFDIYRCLAISLATNSQKDEFARNLELAESTNLMRAIFVTLLSWGKISSAHTMVVDVSKRAPPGGIPSDICEIGLRCHVELIDFLQKLRASGGDVLQTIDGSLKGIALKWRVEINRECGEMKKLKTENSGTQKVVYDWMRQLSAVLRAPVYEEAKGDVSKKMECVLISSEFVHEMLQWAATAPNDEPLHLTWPEGIEPFIINDDSIIVPDRISRSRTTSVGSSTKAAAPAKDDGKKQKHMGEVKQERPARPHDTIQNAPIVEAKQQQKEQTMDVRQDGQNVRGVQRHSQHNPIGASGAPVQLINRGGSNYEKNWRDQPRTTQDVRRSMPQTGDGIEQNGSAGMHSNVYLSNNYTQSHNAPQTIIPRGSMNSSSRGGQFNNSRTELPRSPMPHESLLPRSAPTSSASSSNQDVVSSTIPQFLDDLMKKSQDQSLTHSLASPSPSLPAQSENQVPTMEQTEAKSDESVKMNADVVEAVQQPTVEPPTSPVSQQYPIPQQPTMGTVAANEARARRSLEKVLSVDESSEKETLSEQQSPDSQYQELMKQGDKSTTPDPAEMHKLFTGSGKGQSPLPFIPEQPAGDAVRPATIMQPPPIPTLVAAAESASPSPSSLGLIQLGPPEGIVLPPDYDVTPRTCVSSSAESMLTRITEASQESYCTMSTSLSVSDAVGLPHGEMADAVFEEPNLGELRVNTGQHLFDVQFPATHSISRGSLASVATPNEANLCTPKDSPRNDSPQSQLTPCEYDLAMTNSYNSSNQSRSESRDEMQRQDTPTISPQMSSPLTSESTVTEGSDQTTEVHAAEVRREAEETNQQTILTPIPPVEVVQHRAIEENPSTHSVVTSTPEVKQSEQSEHESAQVVHSEIASATTKEVQSQTSPQLAQSQIPVSIEFDPSLPVQPVQQQYVQQPQNSPMQQVPMGQPLSVDVSEQEVKELVTKCGVQYKFSPPPSHRDEPSSASVSSIENVQSMHQPVQETQGGFLDNFLSMIASQPVQGGEMTQESFSAEQIASASHSMSNEVWSADKSVTKEEIDENAGQRRQYASERGDASEFGSIVPSHPFPETYSDVPTLPSTALTTPDHNGQPPFDYNSGNVQSLGEPSVEEKAEVTQTSASWTAGNEWGEHSQPPTFEQMHQPLHSADFGSQQPTVIHSNGNSFTPQTTTQFNQQAAPFVPNHSVSNGSLSHQHQSSNQYTHHQTQQFGNSDIQQPASNESNSLPQQSGNAVSQHLSIPKYEDPFDKGQPSIPPVNQQQMHHSSTGLSQNAGEKEFVPCFGTGGGVQNAQQQQSGGHGGMNENQNKGFGDHIQDQGGHNQGHGFNNQGRGSHTQNRTFVGRGGQNQCFGGQNQGHGDQSQAPAFSQGFGGQNQGQGEQRHGFNQGYGGQNQGHGDQSQTQGFTQGFGSSQNQGFGGQNQGQGEQSHGFNQGYGGQNQRGRGGGRGDRGGERRGGRGGRGGGGGRGGMQSGGGGGGQGSGFSGFGGGNQQQQQQQSGHGNGDGFGGGDFGHQKENQMNQNQGNFGSQNSRGGAPVRGGRGFH